MSHYLLASFSIRSAFSYQVEFNTIRPHESAGMKRPTDVYVKSDRVYEPEDVLIVYGKGYKSRMVNVR
jgi:hypothetical protein